MYSKASYDGISSVFTTSSPLKQTNDRTENKKNVSILTTERNGTREIALSEGLSG